MFIAYGVFVDNNAMGNKLWKALGWGKARL